MIMSVSYTHLDVYKRQVYKLSKEVIRNNVKSIVFIQLFNIIWNVCYIYIYNIYYKNKYVIIISI